MNLYELDNAIKDIIEKGLSFNEETGEVFEAEDLEKLETSLEEKINNIVGYIKNLLLEEKTYSEIAKDYEARAKEKSNKAERLKKYLDSYLKLNGIENKEVRNGKISYRKSTTANIFDEVKLMKYISQSEELKSKYINTTIKEEISKRNLKIDLDAGINIPGVELKTNMNLQVK